VQKTIDMKHQLKPLWGATLSAFPKRRASRVMGGLAARRVPRALLRRGIALYVRAFGVDLSEAVVPPGGFSTFDAFFTRSLRPGARPLCEAADSLLVPADGRVLDTGRVDVGSRLTIKGRDYTLVELLGSAIAQRFEGGCFAVIYLPPGDYHRVHAPTDGRVRDVQHIEGTLFPVNAIGLALAPRLFARNERVVVVQQGETCGYVATVLVGAFGVGRISLSFEPAILTNAGRVPTEKHYPAVDAPKLQRGDELGVFHLGSTVIVFTERDFPAKVAIAPGDAVRVGQVLARPLGSGERTTSPANAP
jgi:phosphatidylserine decarboxylase